jgi:hypothetical protein
LLKPDSGCASIKDNTKSFSIGEMLALGLSKLEKIVGFLRINLTRSYWTINLSYIVRRRSSHGSNGIIDPGPDPLPGPDPPPEPNPSPLVEPTMSQKFLGSEGSIKKYNNLKNLPL